VPTAASTGMGACCAAPRAADTARPPCFVSPDPSKDALLRRWPLCMRWPAAHLLPMSALRLTPSKSRAPDRPCPPRLPATVRDKVGKGEEEPDGATFSWLCLLCARRKGLHVQLLGWSHSIFTRFAGLRVELRLEPELEPCQTGP
jgi:hypothetical protein